MPSMRTEKRRIARLRPQVSDTRPDRKVPTPNPEKKIILARTEREARSHTRSNSVTSVEAQKLWSYCRLGQAEEQSP